MRGQLHGQGVGPTFERHEGIVGIEAGQEGEAGEEGRVLLGRDADELGEPVVHFAGAVVGDGVHRPFGSFSFSDGARRLDEAVLLEGLDHGVEGAVIEPDALLLGPLAQGLGHLVGVHGLLVEAGQHRQGQGIRAGPTGHG